MPTFTSDGLSLFYRDEGRGSPVLLLHAFPLSSEMFEAQIRALAPTHRVLALDHRGFGHSAVGPGPTAMSRLAQDALALLDHLSISSAVIGGVSMGGYATMAILRQAPTRARAILLLDTQMGTDDDAGRAKREETARAVETRGMEALVESMLPRLVGPRASADVRARVEAIIRTNPPQGAAAALRGLGAREDSSDVLSRFAGPALVLVGDDDVITPVSKAEEMVRVLRGARFVRIEGAGHLANLEATEPVSTAILSFLSTLG